MRDAEGHGGADALLAALSQLLDTLPGAEPGPDARDTLDRALAVVRARRVLVVLDGLERQLGAYSSMLHRLMLEAESGRSDVQASERRLVDGRLRRLLLEALTPGGARVIVTTRLMPEELEATVGVPRRGVALLDLPAVRHAAADELLASLGTPADALLRNEIDRAAGGNPLVLQAAAGALASRRVDPASLVAAVAWEGMPPDALDAMSAARAGLMSLVLSRLDEDERAIAGTVAAFAEPPTTAEVRRVVGRLTGHSTPAVAAGDTGDHERGERQRRLRSRRRPPPPPSPATGRQPTARRKPGRGTRQAPHPDEGRSRQRSHAVGDA